MLASEIKRIRSLLQGFMSFDIFAKSVGLVGAVNFILSLRALILVPILTKSLGAYEYGIWAQILVTVSLLTSIAVLGFPQAEGRFLPFSKSKFELQDDFYSITFFTILISSIISMSLIFFSKDFSSLLLKDDSYSLITIIASIIIILYALDRIFFAFFTSRIMIKIYSIFITAQCVFEISLIVYATHMNLGLWGAVTAIVISNIIVIILMLIFIYSQIGFKFPRFSRLKTYLKFGLPIVPILIFSWVIDSSDRYFIAYFTDPSQVGIYSTAYGIGFLTQILINPIGIVLFPLASKLWDEGNFVEFKKYISYSLKIFLVFGIPSIFGLSVLSKSLLAVLSTSEFLPGASLVPFICTGFLFYGIYSIFYYILTSVKRTDLIALSMCIASMIHIIADIIFIPVGGLLGASIASHLTYAFLGIYVMNLSKKYIKINLEFSFIIKSIASSANMAFAIYLLNPKSLFEIVMCITIGAIIYFISLYILRGFGKDEISEIKKTIGL